MSELAYDTPQGTLSVYNPALEHFPEVPSDTTVASLLENRVLYDDPKIRSASLETKISALTDFGGAYVPLDIHGRVLQEAVRKGRQALGYRNVNDSSYAKFLLRLAGGLNSRMAQPLPPSPMRHGQKVEGMLLAGSAGNGRSTLMAKMAGVIGTEPEPLRGTVAVPVGLHLVRVLFLRWPPCGTPEGFYHEFRSLVDGLLGTEFANEAARRNFKKAHLGPSTKSIALLLSTAILFVDGVSTSNVNGASGELFNFFADFMSYTGIPVVISCSSPIVPMLARMGGVGASFGVSRAHWFDNMAMGPEFLSMVHFYWGHDLRREQRQMPRALPQVLHDRTLGNQDFLRSVMRKTLIELLTSEHAGKSLTANETVALVENVADSVLAPYRPLFRLRRQGASPSTIADKDRRAWAEYLPREYFDLLPSENEPNRLA